MDSDEAKLDFERRCKATPHLTDDLGPPKGKKRVWVHTDDIVSFDQDFERVKEYESEEKVVKKPKPADYDAAHSWLTDRHDVHLSSAGSAQSAEEMASLMMRSSNESGQAWQGTQAVFAGGVKAMLGDSEAEEEAKEKPPKKGKSKAKDDDDDEDVEGEEGEDESAEEDEEWDEPESKTTGRGLVAAGAKAQVKKGKAVKDQKGKETKSEKWFDRDKYVAGSEGKIATWEKTTRTTCEALILSMQEALEDARTVVGEEALLVCNEHKILNNRCLALKLVTSTDSDAATCMSNWISTAQAAQETARRPALGGAGLVFYRFPFASLFCFVFASLFCLLACFVLRWLACFVLLVSCLYICLYKMRIYKKKLTLRAMTNGFC